MPNRITAVQECDATVDDSSNAAGGGKKLEYKAGQRSPNNGQLKKWMQQETYG